MAGLMNPITNAKIEEVMDKRGLDRFNAHLLVLLKVFGVGDVMELPEYEALTKEHAKEQGEAT